MQLTAQEIIVLMKKHVTDLEALLSERFTSVHRDKLVMADKIERLQELCLMLPDPSEAEGLDRTPF